MLVLRLNRHKEECQLGSHRRCSTVIRPRCCLRDTSSTLVNSNSSSSLVASQVNMVATALLRLDQVNKVQGTSSSARMDSLCILSDTQEPHLGLMDLLPRCSPSHLRCTV